MQHHSTGSRHGPDGTRVPKIIRKFLFFMLTGLRINEVLGLRWRDVQDSYFTISSDVSKNKKAHKMPVVGTLKTLIGKRGADNKTVFGYTSWLQDS